MITNNGFKILLNRAYKSVPDYTIATKFKVGVSQSILDVTDTDLFEPIPIYNTIVCNCDVTTDWNKTTDGKIDTSTSVIKSGSYSLTLYKDGTANADVTYYNQNLTTRDLTSQTLWGWFYIKDQTTLDKLAVNSSLEVRYGNDYNTNYYKFVYDKSDLEIGWNIIKFNTTTGTEVGSVTLNACDSLAIKLTFTNASQTLAKDDIIIDDFKLANSSDYFKDYTIGYPIINETNSEVVTECYLNSVEANGFFINSVGTFNSTSMIQDIFKFTPISKSETDELIIEIRNRLTRR